MSADTLTYRYPDYPSYYDSRVKVAGDVLLAGLLWLCVLHLLVKPLKLFDCENPKTLKIYNDSGLPTRWPLLFNSIRDYENIQ